MAWRNCGASLKLVAEINARWPNRDKASDGTIGDAAHATRTSDHNPWVVVNGIGVVRARDIDKDGIDAAWLAEYLRTLGARRDPRLYPGGYVIFNRRITTPDFTAWKAYTGTNPHTAHVHVSFSTAQAGFDSNAPWGITATAPAPKDWFDMATEADLRRIVEEALTAQRPRQGQGMTGTTSIAAVAQWSDYAWTLDRGLGVQVRDELSAFLKNAGTKTVPGPATLTDTDVQRIAEAVVSLFGKKASA